MSCRPFLCHNTSSCCLIGRYIVWISLYQACWGVKSIDSICNSRTVFINNKSKRNFHPLWTVLCNEHSHISRGLIFRRLLYSWNPLTFPLGWWWCLCFVFFICDTILPQISQKSLCLLFHWKPVVIKQPMRTSVSHKITHIFCRLFEYYKPNVGDYLPTLWSLLC